MRTGKDEVTQMDPLFPRLHINDTEKGGPRAPPRNKMALYEEITVTSQRTSSGSISGQPLPPIKDRRFNPSGSQSHVGSPQKSRFSLFCSWPESSEMAQDHHSCSSTSINFDTQLTNSEIQILKPENYQKFSSTRASKMISECHLFRPFSFYNSKNSFVETVAKEDNLRHPYFSQLDKMLHCGDLGGKLESKKLISTSLSFSEKHQIASGERQKWVKSTDLKSRELLGNSTEDNHEVQMREENPETPSLLSIGKNNLLDATTNQLTRNMTSGSGTRAPMYQAGCNLVNDDKFRLHDPCEQSRKVCRTSQENIARTDGTHENLEKFSRKSCSRMKDSSCSNEDSGENNQILNIKDSVKEFPTRDNDLEIGDAEKSIAMSGASLADPKSDFNISPDDVVGLIGPKLFWRVRRTIAHQQRIFAVQIFELHRLIKVQRLVAKSPEMLSEDTPHISKPVTKCSPVEKLLTQNVPEVTSSFMKRKADPQGPNWRPETAAEDANAKLPPLDCNSEEEHNTPMSTLRPLFNILNFSL